MNYLMRYSERNVDFHRLRGLANWVAIGALLAIAATAFADSAAGLKWTPPPDWANQGTRPMRAATYFISPVAGQKGGGECAVYYFGKAQGGSVEANIERWKGQFIAPGNKPVDGKVQKRSIHGLPVTTIDVSGEYTGMGGPMAAEKSTKPDYRLLGAVIEGPAGNVFVKFTGPSKLVAANQQKFEQLLGSFEKVK